MIDDNTRAPEKVTRLSLRVAYWPHETTLKLQVSYVPMIDGNAYKEVPINTYAGQVQLSEDEIKPQMRTKLDRLYSIVEHQLAQPPLLEVDGLVVQTPTIDVDYLFISESPGHGIENLGNEIRLTLAYTMVTSGQSENQSWFASSLTPAAQRLIDNLLAGLAQLGWDDLRARAGGTPIMQTTKKKVLVSYRRTTPDHAAFAKAVAHRLGSEGFLPWFDDWEIQAGDSIAGEINNGFKDVHGVIIVLTSDYPAGKWARREMETAITKGIEDGIHVIPVLFEPCEVPELLRTLKYVDCTEHNPEVFESQFGKVIDALNELDLNPYRL